MMRAWIVDTFADELYDGNPAAVIIRRRAFPHPHAMQSIARRLGLPTTAFVVPGEPDRYRIRWFTPEKELNICGHATIATAGYLYEVGGVSAARELCFETGQGPLYTRLEGGYVSVSLPRMDVRDCAAPEGLEDALGSKIVYCGRATDDVLIGVENEGVVAGLRPDFERMRRIEGRGHVVTAASDSGRVDFVSRTFFPALGVDEDQVCVSAHCKLGPYWAGKLGKRELNAVQLSARGGRLRLEVSEERVRVSGTAAVRGQSGPIEG